MLSTRPFARAAAACASLILLAGAAVAQGAPPVPAEVQRMAREIAAELAAKCPVAAANDTAAFDACRKGLFGPSELRARLPAVLLWGRQAKDLEATLRQTHLTQFAPDPWIGMYAPLFMFNGKHTVEWVPREKRFLIRLEATFRNRLQPGQFPYPFWHEEAKWGTYENANGWLLWVDPSGARLSAAQFTDRAPNAKLQPVLHVQQAKHDGQWMWTDGQGKTQPAVTLFDGLYSAANPHLRAMERSYRDMALQMRESQCQACHVPNNPDKMSRLVLLSTPAHAAGEVDRVIKSVKEDRMPMDEFRMSYALSSERKKALLESAEAFKAVVQSARDWESQQAARHAQSRPAKSTEVSQ